MCERLPSSSSVLYTHLSGRGQIKLQWMFKTLQNLDVGSHTPTQRRCILHTLNVFVLKVWAWCDEHCRCLDGAVIVLIQPVSCLYHRQSSFILRRLIVLISLPSPIISSPPFRCLIPSPDLPFMRQWGTWWAAKIRAPCPFTRRSCWELLEVWKHAH